MVHQTGWRLLRSTCESARGMATHRYGRVSGVEGVRGVWVWGNMIVKTHKVSNNFFVLKNCFCHPHAKFLLVTAASERCLMMWGIFLFFYFMAPLTPTTHVRTHTRAHTQAAERTKPPAVLRHK